MSGIFRRSVARTELPLILDVRFGLGKMDLERPVVGTAGAGATRMHVAWNDGDWSFDSYVDLPPANERLTVCFPAGLVDVTWMDASGSPLLEESVQIVAGTSLRLDGTR